MHAKRYRWLVCLLCFVAFCLASCETEPKPVTESVGEAAADAEADQATEAPVRILCLGDSITQGGKRDREEYTYRWPLFQMLVDAGVAFDFVGSRTQGLHGDAKWPAEHKGVAFDPDHDGVYGIKTGKMAERIETIAAEWPAPPDIALIHLGTNDQGAEDHTKAIVEPLRHIIDVLRRQNSRVVILLGHLNFNGGKALQIRPLVEALAAEETTEASPIITVHHYRLWHEKPREAGSDTFDWAHPNPQGQRKMAEKWFEAMKPWLKLDAG